MDLQRAIDFIRPRTSGILTTVKRDGRPQLSNVAYTLGGDGVIRISVTANRAKTANMRRDPRVSLYVGADDFRSYVVVEGQAELSAVATRPDDAAADELVEYYRAVAGEHSNWDEYRNAMVSDRRLVVRLRPAYAYGMA